MDQTSQFTYNPFDPNYTPMERSLILAPLVMSAQLLELAAFVAQINPALGLAAHQLCLDFWTILVANCEAHLNFNR